MDTNINPDSVLITPAHRVECVEEYYFSLKLKEIARMNEQGADVINLGIGSPDLPPSDATIKALCNCAMAADSHGYQSYIGIPELRNEFAIWYKKHYNVNLNSANEILPLMGSKEGIMHISMAFINEGDGVLVPNPGYPTYASVSKLVGAKIINYSLKEENGWHPNLLELEQANERGEISLASIKLMWCNYPNMPTGANGSIELFKKLVNFGKKYNIIICHDNPYSFILNDTPLSILSVPGAKDICIELNSMSKTFNMPGWRIGMAASNKQFIEWILRVKSNMDSGMFRAMQMAAVEALKAPDSWYENMTAIYMGRRALATAILEKAGAVVAPGQVGLFLWGKVEKDCREICDKILYNSKVFITPGFIFGLEGEKYVRISLCANEKMLEKALARM
ncbi:MAG: aminotransferase class I/II-fold pyridoxal phosphate-dependent enzyme [Bacteroidales bacterium]